MTIYFLNDNTLEIDRYYIEKEYRDDVIVKIKDLYYEVYFFTKDALEYEMTSDGFFSFPGMIILEKVSVENIIKSIVELSNKDFFNNFKGSKSLNQRERYLHKWYHNELSLYDENRIKSITIE